MLPDEVVTDPRFPVGRFHRPKAGETLPEGELANAIAEISELPEQLRKCRSRSGRRTAFDSRIAREAGLSGSWCIISRTAT